MATQINLRMDEKLLDEVDALAEMLHIPRSEWMRVTLAREVKEELMRLRETAALEYVRGHLSYDRLKYLLGTDAEDIKLIKKVMEEGKEEIDRLAERKS